MHDTPPSTQLKMFALVMSYEKAISIGEKTNNDNASAQFGV